MRRQDFRREGNGEVSSSYQFFGMLLLVTALGQGSESPIPFPSFFTVPISLVYRRSRSRRLYHNTPTLVRQGEIVNNEHDCSLHFCPSVYGVFVFQFLLFFLFFLKIFRTSANYLHIGIYSPYRSKNPPTRLKSSSKR